MFFDLQTFTLIHVLISLVGIGTGLVFVFAILSGNWLPRMNAMFLWTTILTSVTGFAFPFRGFTPAIGVGILSMVILVIAAYSLYLRRLSGGWRRTYLITSILALYLNVFVLVVQSFQKIPSLHDLAPNQNEPPFQIAQGAVLVLFIVLGTLAVKRSRNVPIV